MSHEQLDMSDDEYAAMVEYYNEMQSNLDAMSLYQYTEDGFCDGFTVN